MRRVALGLTAIILLVAIIFMIMNSRSFISYTMNAIGLGYDTGCPVMDAVMEGNPHKLESLLKEGNDANGCEPDRAPLHQASRDPKGDLTRILLAYGADPNRTYNKETPLWEAALMGHTSPAEALIDAGADINSGNILNSPAITAATAGHWLMVEYLLSRGADLTRTSSSGQTIALIASLDRLRPEIPEGQARDRIITRLKEENFPWPPPKPAEVRERIEAGTWPYQIVKSAV